MRHRLLLPVVALLAGGAVAGCGDDQPAVCTWIDELQSSVKGLADLELTGSSSAGGLEDQVALVVQDFKQVKDDASEEYDDQVGAIDADVEKLEDERAAVKDSPSATTVADLKRAGTQWSPASKPSPTTSRPPAERSALAPHHGRDDAGGAGCAEADAAVGGGAGGRLPWRASSSPSC